MQKAIKSGDRLFGVPSNIDQANTRMATNIRTLIIQSAIRQVVMKSDEMRSCSRSGLLSVDEAIFAVIGKRVDEESGPKEWAIRVEVRWLLPKGTETLMNTAVAIRSRILSWRLRGNEESPSNVSGLDQLDRDCSFLLGVGHATGMLDTLTAYLSDQSSSFVGEHQEAIVAEVVLADLSTALAVLAAKGDGTPIRLWSSAELSLPDEMYGLYTPTFLPEKDNGMNCLFRSSIWDCFQIYLALSTPDEELNWLAEDTIVDQSAIWPH